MTVRRLADISVHASAFDIYLALAALPNLGWLDPNVTETYSDETSAGSDQR